MMIKVTNPDLGVTVDDEPNDPESNLTGYQDIPEFTAIAGLNMPPGTETPLALFLFDFPPCRSHSWRNKPISCCNHRPHAAPLSQRFLKKWKNLDRNYILGFLLVLIHMSTEKKKSIKLYTPGAVKCVSQHHLRPWLWAGTDSSLFCNLFILATRYVAPNIQSHDPLHKIQIIYEHLKATFQDLNTPEKKISLDEAICPWRERLRFKVYIKKQMGDKTLWSL